MAIQSSYTQVAEQVINFNNNVVSLLSNINTLITSTEPTVTVSITDQSGVARQFSLPSFGFLKSEIDRLNNNLNSIYSVNDAGALIQPSNGTRFRKVVTVDLNKEPNDINNLATVSTFKQRKNWFFDGLMNPQIFVELDLTNKIENNVRKILCRRYIPEFEKESTSGNFTPLAQSAINSFNSLFRNRNDFTLEEYEQWYRNTPGLILPNNPNYDEQMFDLEPNKLEFDGLFSVLRIEEDTLNRKIFYHVNTLTYVRNYQNLAGDQLQESKQLVLGDELIINTPVTSTRYRILEISNTASNPRLRLERIEGMDPIPVGIGTLKIYSPVLYDKRVMISVGFNERNVVFVKALNMDNYILSKNWSTGLGYFTNDLREDVSGLSMEQFYTDTVIDYGKAITDLVVKRIPNTLGVTPNVPTLISSNFEVLQANRHLTDTVDYNLLKRKHNQQKNLKSEIAQLSDTIEGRNKKLKTTRFASVADRKQFSLDIDFLNKQKESKSKLLASVTNEILSLTNSPNIKADPMFRVRGFWAIPESVSQTGGKAQKVVQFRVQYKYLSKDGRESPVETKKISDGSAILNASISNWIEYKTDVRKRTFYASTGTYEWLDENLASPDEPNINQVDIPITYGEQVVIRVKSISEVGWPESALESAWSEELIIAFPDNLNSLVNDSDYILNDALKEDLRNTINNDLNARGLDEHLSGQFTSNGDVYHHSSEKIISGFKDSLGNALNLKDYLMQLEDRIKLLEEKVQRLRGQMEVTIFRNNEGFIIRNGSNVVFEIECEDYLDDFVSPGVPSGRIYKNSLYVIKEFLLKVKNKAVESRLGLLSNRNYQTNNIEVYNSNCPQVFWVNQLDELIADNSTGTTKTQVDNQFIWMVNYDANSSGKLDGRNTIFGKLSENIGNNFTNSNSITNALSQPDKNIGFSENGILAFQGNNNSLLDINKWIDKKVSIWSQEKLLTTVHPEVPSLTEIQENNSEKVRVVESGEENDINIPINIYFKMNALNPNLTKLNLTYIDLNKLKNTVRHIKKLKFFIENEAENRPFVFTVTFQINRVRTAKQIKISGVDLGLKGRKITRLSGR
jgi:hypothetical protein